ncbi:MAG: putative toxin-antitoxin system toxin component, PIN family [Chitinophagaceae bacterium]|jgi:putative PIN family toxin of toxin-antitoxin system|nr:putative toxin-antitoxin system toxin component, PIN family [Chitinophagaceae bacterium]
MKVVLDTNVLLVILPNNSKYHNVFQALRQRRYSICFTTDILLEYEEVFSYRYSQNSLVEMFAELVGTQKGEFITTSFRFNLIEADPDDNKFVDCAIAADADFIITNDRHFNILGTIPFPKVETLTLQEFQNILFPQ